MPLSFANPRRPLSIGEGRQEKKTLNPVTLFFSPTKKQKKQIKDIGSGNFGVAKLMRDKATGELVAVKFIERGDKVRREERSSRGKRKEEEETTAGGTFDLSLSLPKGGGEISNLTPFRPLFCPPPPPPPHTLTTTKLPSRSTATSSASSSTTGPSSTPTSCASRRSSSRRRTSAS